MTNFECRSANAPRSRASARLKNMFDAANGNHHPIGSIVKLVADLVNSLIEEISFEEDLKVVRLLRHKDRAGGGLQITVQKHATHLAVPHVSPTFEKRH